jgi:hypothetical protein
MTSILVETVLFGREFGRAAVTTTELKRWAQKRGVVIPPMQPSLEGFDAVALESLLVAFERALPSMDDDVARDLALSLPCSPSLQRLIEENTAPMARWYVGANIHKQWRGMLVSAIAARELQTIDALTGAPIAQAQDTAGQVKVKRQAEHREQVLKALESAGYTAKALPKYKTGTKNPAKTAARAALPNMTKAVFDRAWQELLDGGDLVNP